MFPKKEQVEIKQEVNVQHMLFKVYNSLLSFPLFFSKRIISNQSSTPLKSQAMTYEYFSPMGSNDDDDIKMWQLTYTPGIFTPNDSFSICERNQLNKSSQEEVEVNSNKRQESVNIKHLTFGTSVSQVLAQGLLF